MFRVYVNIMAMFRIAIANKTFLRHKEGNMRQIARLAILIMVMIVTNLAAAPHSFLPIEATQPDGSKINIYASGDEFHNWLHDADNYTIVKDDTGAYVYAMQERGRLVPSDLLVGRDRPNVRGIVPGLNLSQDEIREKYERYSHMRDYSGSRAPHSGQLNNIVIFIKFSDSPEFSTSFSYYQQIHNAPADDSMKRYFQAASYNQLTIDSHFYPAPNGNTVLSYTDSYPRSYFQPYSSSNPNGYSGDSQRATRERQLLKRAVEAVRSGIPSSLVIDGDNDGKVDNVCFIVQGATDGWADLLWPHRWNMYTTYVYINNKRVYDFNFQLENSLNYSGASVLSHEMFHSLGAPDLYRYYNTDISPVGSWDLMATNLTPPQHMSAWMKHRYGQWISSSNVPTITTSGTYTLHPVASASTNNIYRIKSWKAGEDYLLEYRKSDGTYDGNLPGTGLLVYRLNTSVEGNADGPPDELYIYRPGGTNSINGNLSQAHFSAQTGRTELSEATTPNGFLRDDSAGGLNLFDVGTAGDTITFKVKISEIQLTSPHGGEIWQSGTSKVITWKSKVTTGSVKLEYSSDGGQNWNLITSSTSNSGSYTWNNVPAMNNSEDVHVRVTHLSSNQWDSNYYPFAVATGTMLPPRHLTATASNGSVRLDWQTPLTGTPTSYRIYRNGSLLTTITNFNYIDNSVVNETTYSYHVIAIYSSGVSDPSNTVQATPSASLPREVVIGTGTGSTGTSVASPINVYYRSRRGQSVYTKAELNAAGVEGPIQITRIGFNITGLPARTMPNFVIRIGHTTATNASNWITTGLTQVWSEASYRPTATGWNMYTLSTPFLWNGTDNIVIDTAFGLTESWNSSGTVQFTTVTSGYRYGQSDSVDQTDIFSTGYTSNYRPNIRLAVLPIEATIGSGTGSTGTSAASPINVWYKSLHGQSVYTKAELNAVGVIGPTIINQIGFNVTGLPDYAMPNFVIRMGHTAAADASDWISTGLKQVWNSASYQPTATGWNMYVLSTPFLWNGIDNIVIDTAFGICSDCNRSGTTQYTSVPNGYRYVRRDGNDQTNVFSGGSTSNLRPNLKLAYQAAPDGPLLDVIPVSLAFGDVAVGSNAVKTFTIRNFGNQTLTGTITTPAGYTVAEAGRSTRILESTGGSRYSMGFTVAAGASKTYNLTFAPTAATAYNGNVVISGNAVNEASVNIAVSGTGYILPTISIDGNALSANLQVGTSGTDSFTITNNGSRPLTFDICMAQQSPRTIDKPQAASKQDKSIAGSTFTLDATHYLPGTTVDWTFTVTNGSTDTEWITDMIITFPTGVTVNSVTNFVGGSGGDLTPNLSSGEGVTITWHGETSNGYGLIKGGESASATVNVSIASGFSGYLTLPWTINGDEWQSEPHTLSGSVALAEDFLPIDWLSVHPVSGSIAGGESVTITANFSAVGMAVGNYAAQITVYSNDTANPSPNVNATMEVWDSVPTPEITAITKIDGGFRITWTAVEHADCYEVWRATEPYGTYERIGSNISALQYDDLSNLPLGFYYVKAIRN